jgi:hypothetical protein
MTEGKMHINENLNPAEVVSRLTQAFAAIETPKNYWGKLAQILRSLAPFIEELPANGVSWARIATEFRDVGGIDIPPKLLAIRYSQASKPPRRKKSKAHPTSPDGSAPRKRGRPRKNEQISIKPQTQVSQPGLTQDSSKINLDDPEIDAALAGFDPETTEKEVKGLF